MSRGRKAGFSTRQGVEALCNSCRLVLPAACFRTRTVAGHVYLRSTCRNCEHSSVGQKKAIKKWQEKNPNRLKAAAAKYRKAHPDRTAAQYARWRGAQRGAASTLTSEEWAEIKATGSCMYCGRSDVALTMDHVIPLSRGGAHTKDNVVPACKPCNSSKKDKTPAEWHIWKQEMN